MRGTAIAVLSCAALAHCAAGDEFVDTFDGGENVGGWTYFAPNEAIESTGGNPGWFLHAWNLDTFAPQPQTSPGTESPFIGDYRAMGVSEISVDLRLFHVDFSAAERPLAVILVEDRGTPSDYFDDIGAFVLGDEVPLVEDGWKTISYAIPAEETSLPAGWRSLDFSGNGRNVDWNALISGVDRVHFFYGDPENFFIFQMWDVGLDNARIVFGTASAATLTDFEVVTGTLLDGGLAELDASDDEYLRVRSGFGGSFLDLHNAEVHIFAETDATGLGALDISIESHVSHPSGLMVLQALNHASGQFETLGQFQVSDEDVVREVSEVPADDYISDAGEIVLSIEHRVFVPFFAFQFDQSIDEAAIFVR